MWKYCPRKGFSHGESKDLSTGSSIDSRKQGHQVTTTTKMLTESIAKEQKKKIHDLILLFSQRYRSK